MRQLFAVALVVAVVAAPACAQHVGGARGGFGGHAGFGARGGFSGMSSGTSSGRVAGRAFAPRYGVGVRGGERAPAARFVRPGVSGARPGGYHRDWDRRRAGYAGPLGYAYYAPLNYGWLDANDPGYDDGYSDNYGDGSWDDGSADDGSRVAAESGGEPPPADYAAPPQGYGQGYGQGYAQPMTPYPQQPPAAYAEGAHAASAQAVSPSLYDSGAVTLVFKDGRPPEKIHNYALTRTMLYVTDGRHQEIPVATLDLAATEKTNRAAGVNFQLPVSR